MIKFECNACGGSIREEGKFWVCENCGTRFALSRDDEGQPFIYNPVEKKTIQCGQVAAKASALEVSDILVREIKLKDNITAEVHDESMNLDTNEIIKNTEAYISHGEWEKVQEQINRLLLADKDCPEAQWFLYMHSKKMTSEIKMVQNWTDFTEFDKNKLDKMLSDSSPDFALHIINLILDYGYANDTMCYLSFSAVLPYAINESLYDQELLAEKIQNAFETVTAKTYERSFLYLLTHTLKSDEVDKYIDYLNKFAQNCSPLASQQYLQMIIDVDPENIEIRKRLIKADLISDTNKNKCIGDIEGLLGYSKNTDNDIYEIITYLNSEKTTTQNKSDLFWDLLGYHSKAPGGLIEELTQYAFVLINSALWEEARKFLNLILSVDARYSKAYFGLCLIKIKARNEEEISTRKDNLIDCNEFDKCLALYRAAGDTDMVNKLMAFTKKQKDTKQARKLAIRVGVAIAVFILIIFSIKKINYSRNYSVNNIVVSVTDKENDTESVYYGNYKTTLTLEIKNKSAKEILEVYGELKIYNSDDDLILNSDTTLYSKIESKDKEEVTINLNSGITKYIEEIYTLGLENLKITFRVTGVIYEDYELIEYPDSKEKVINEITEKASYKEVKESRLKKQYNKMIEAYALVDINSLTADEDVINAVAYIDEVWEDFIASEKYMSDLYNEAMRYKDNQEYEKAYYLFALLSKINYSDSYYQEIECYDLVMGY